MSAWDLAGCLSASSVLKGDIEAGRAAHAYLFAGPAGTIKRALADVFMRALHCESDRDRPCGVCPSCRRHLAGEHPDVHVLEAVKSAIGVDEVRSLLAAISVRPLTSDKHLVLLPQAGKLTPQAQNALLKTLEEPTGDVVFILLADSPRELLPTVNSRVRLVRFVLPTVKETEDALVKSGMETGRARLLSRLSGGDMDLARRMDADKEYWALRERVKRALAELSGPASSAPCARLLKDDKDGALPILEDAARDAMVYPDDPDAVKSLDMASVIEQYAPLGQTFLEGVMSLKMRVSSNVSWVNALECLFMDISGGKTLWQP